MASKKELSVQERLFVHEYLLDCSAVRAAVRAGYAESTAAKKAPLWVGKSRRNSPKPHVWDAVQALMDKRADKLEISAERVLAELRVIGFVSFDDPMVKSGLITTKDKLRALELIGKHLGMFREVVELDIPTLDKVLERLEGGNGARHLKVVPGAK